MGTISVCLSEGDWDHKETYMDQTQKGPLHTTLSILMPEKLLSFFSQGKALLDAQLVTAGVIDRVWQGSVQVSSRFSYMLSFLIMVIMVIFHYISLTLYNVSKYVAIDVCTRQQWILFALSFSRNIIFFTNKTPDCMLFVITNAKPLEWERNTKSFLRDTWIISAYVRRPNSLEYSLNIPNSRHYTVSPVSFISCDVQGETD